LPAAIQNAGSDISAILKVRSDIASPRRASLFRFARRCDAALAL
jgi:hypothetical protein